MLDTTDGRSLRSGFLASAMRHPDAPALVCRDVTRSYGELEAAARTWAASICDLVGGPAERVGVFAARSETAYTGVLAALMSGAAFVPLNPTFPQARTRSMIELACLDTVIVDDGAMPQLVAIAAELPRCPPILVPESEGHHLRAAGRRVLSASALSVRRPLDLLPPVLPEQVAYLLFTSGSTGTPKGVPVTHANVLHFLDVMMERYRIGRNDRLSQTFDQTFDLSVFDLFMAWEGGASVHVPQPLELIAPTRFITKHELTVWFSVPSIPALMRKKGFLKPDSFPRLRLSLFCGEPLPAASAEAWQAAAPNAILENLYGPTELTIACLLHQWDRESSPALCVNGMVPIGRPYPGLGALLVDEALHPVADGEAGELCVCGPQTAPGYWQDAGRTAERFVSLPVSPTTALRFYRTGDRVVRLPSGEYAYIGRVDHQVKVLGHRVELGDVEAALRADPAVVEAIAVGWPVEDGTTLGVVAFVSGADIDPASLKRAARGRLPDYMVPREIRIIDRMPLNANGKIDRNVLRASLEHG